jgi:4-amino-4-deoxy-L-arabinose transferase-like glycosyltransferase
MMAEKTARATVLRWLGSPSATWILAAAGLLLRLLALAVAARQPLADDALDYHETALKLLRGESFEPDWPPGLPYFLASACAIFGPSELTSRAAMVLLWCGFAAALFALGRRAGGVEAGNLALLLFAVFPSYVLLSVTPLTQLPAATLLLAAAVVSLRLIDRPSFGRGLAVGLTLAGLVLVRPSNLLLCAALPLYLFARTRRLAALVAPALVIALLVGAWSLKARAMTGRFVLINDSNSANLFCGNNPWTPLYRTWWFGSHKAGEPDVPDEYLREHQRIARLPIGERDHEFSRAALRHVLGRPDLFVVRSASRVRTYFAFDTFAGAQLAKGAHLKHLGLLVIAVDAALYLAVAALALWLLIAAPPPGGPLLALLVLLYSAPYFISFSHPTYHFPVVPLLGVLAAVAGARLLAGELRAPLRGARRVGLIAALALLAAIQLEWIANMSSRI